MARTTTHDDRGENIYSSFCLRSSCAWRIQACVWDVAWVLAGAAQGERCWCCVLPWVCRESDAGWYAPPPVTAIMDSGHRWTGFDLMVRSEASSPQLVTNPDGTQNGQKGEWKRKRVIMPVFTNQGTGSALANTVRMNPANDGAISRTPRMPLHRTIPS
jgi:hypothetical protein